MKATSWPASFKMKAAGWPASFKTKAADWPASRESSQILQHIIKIPQAQALRMLCSSLATNHDSLWRTFAQAPPE